MSDVSSWVERLADAVEQVLGSRSGRPDATYRLQFVRREFTFRGAAAVVPYLSELGVSHVYTSPCLKARSGSPHGYDVVDHSRLDPELGGEEGFAELAEALRCRDMGHVIDIVPNHMGVATSDNPWWNDVLENGPSSPFAHFFDIDWHPVAVKSELKNKILLPLLGDQYGEVLETGQLKLAYDDGAFCLRYYETTLPLEPGTYGIIVSHRLEELREALPSDADELMELESIITALEYLPDRTETDAERVAERQREKEVIKGRLRRLVNESSVIAGFIEQNLRDFNGNPEDPSSYDLLDDLLSRQVFRLAHWKAAADEINYRRFFDINDLAALCMEDPDVFAATHRLVFDLLVRGGAEGLRIDHIDGLFDPTEYLWRLQWGYVRALGRAAYQSICSTAFPTGTEEPALTSREDVSEKTVVHEIGSGTSPATVMEVIEPRAAEALGEPPQWDQLEPPLLRELWQRLGGVPPELVFPSAKPSDEDGGEAASSNGQHTREERLSARPWTDEAQIDAIPPMTTPRSHAERRSQAEPGNEKAGEVLRLPRLPLYVVVEKILEADEPLPQQWPVAGSTGYDFLRLVNGLFVDPSGLDEVVKSYGRFIGHRMDFSEVAYQSKLLILRVAMASELQLLTYRINRLSERHRRSRDFTFNNLRMALREILACFPVYRTYIGAGGISDRDRHFLQLAVAKAKRRNPAMDAGLFNFVRDTLLLEQPPGLDERGRLEREFFVGRFQQTTSPVTAKGVEDTAFYRYFPLASLNEVGCAPDGAPAGIEEFHHENRTRLAQRPRSLVATTSHDTKRSEDVRARINVLSEIPHQWRRAVQRWSRLNRRHRREVAGEPAPSRNDEYLFYETLVGIWPLEPPDGNTHAQLVGRVQGYMEKATHEAKLRTSWINPNPDYDEAVRDFVTTVLDDGAKNRFLAEFRDFHERVVRWGLYTALSQAFLKLAAPGVPDLYQGQELWNFSLVDPDNRRSVDFDLHRHLLAEVKETMSGGHGEGDLLKFSHHLAHHPADNRLKLLVTWRTLQFRRQYADLFYYGQYVPLRAEGSRADHVAAFAWRWQPSPDEPEQIAVAVAPRLLARLTPPQEASGRRESPGEGNGTTPPPLGSAVWEDTHLMLDELPDVALKNLLTGQSCTPQESRLPLAEALADFPVALLTNCDER